MPWEHESVATRDRGFGIANNKRMFGVGNYGAQRGDELIVILDASQRPVPARHTGPKDHARDSVWCNSRVVDKVGE